MWTYGFDQKEQAKEFNKTVGNSTEVLNRLDSIIHNMQIALFDEESSTEDYANSDWAYLQAHRNGMKEVLRKLKKLTQHLDQR